MTPAAILSLYFGWPTGSVWSNLIASAICAGLVWWRLHKQAARQHVAVLAQAAKHHFERLAQAEEHHQALKELAEQHHQELKRHVSAAIQPTAPMRSPVKGER